MTAARKKRLRRKRRFVRNIKRTVVAILLMPARMPKINSVMIDQAMHASEVSGMIFVALLMMHLFNPKLIALPLVVLSAMCFIFFLMVIKLGDYQDRLEEMRYYGYNI